MRESNRTHRCFRRGNVDGRARRDDSSVRVRRHRRAATGREAPGAGGWRDACSREVPLQRRSRPDRGSPCPQAHDSEQRRGGALRPGLSGRPLDVRIRHARVRPRAGRSSLRHRDDSACGWMPVRRHDPGQGTDRRIHDQVDDRLRPVRPLHGRPGARQSRVRGAQVRDGSAETQVGSTRIIGRRRRSPSSARRSD